MHGFLHQMHKYMLFVQIPTAQEYPIVRARESSAGYYREYVASAPPDLREQRLLFPRGSRNHRHDYMLTLFNDKYCHPMVRYDSSVEAHLIVKRYTKSFNNTLNLSTDKFAALRSEYTTNQYESVTGGNERCIVYIPRRSFINARYVALGSRVIHVHLRNRKTIPRAITRMTMLNTLDVTCSLISRIPRFISKCKKLQNIYMQHNDIQEIPSHFKKIIYSNLNLSCTPIREFKNIKIKKYGYLSLSNTAISRISTMSLRNITLDLTCCHIVEFLTPDEMQKMGYCTIVVSEDLFARIIGPTHQINIIVQ